MPPYSIGVVTYHARFQQYFVPLIKKLSTVFPDREILAIINGHPDRTLQINYLNDVTVVLSQFHNVRYLTYDAHQSLSKCWNQLVILSRTEKILIMNDDTQVTDLFRQEFENKVLPLPFSTINASWSHFLISKDIIKKNGWFDERLLGVGMEDADFGMRMSMAQLPLTDTTCLGLNNYVANEENPGWKDISKKVGTSKYALTNLEFFKTKWITSDLNPEIPLRDFTHTLSWNGIPLSFSPKTNDPVPSFYDISCLDHKQSTSLQYSAYAENRFKLALQKSFFACKQMFKKIYRTIVS